MTAGRGRPRDDGDSETRNIVTGNQGNAVQAEKVSGGVHFNQTPGWVWYVLGSMSLVVALLASILMVSLSSDRASNTGPNPAPPTTSEPVPTPPPAEEFPDQPPGESEDDPAPPNPPPTRNRRRSACGGAAPWSSAVTAAPAGGGTWINRRPAARCSAISTSGRPTRSGHCAGRLGFRGRARPRAVRRAAEHPSRWEVGSRPGRFDGVFPHLGRPGRLFHRDEPVPARGALPVHRHHGHRVGAGVDRDE
ncbi:hypothetical protein TL08_16135 [Actinoalloteichus hymeniacidonis]|uniref:Uncharacterized protein n=1 Tax=Actinoalloteichus hymeniacidonis TaxID=340345 RepID=A0AAC9HR25_9PSEU|nr:hypothetical protein TL08_16135 [Actinoalloteichus hymeniacidonis]